MNEYPKIFYSNVTSANSNIKEQPNFKPGWSESYFNFRLEKYFHYYLRKNFVINDGRDYPFHPDFIIFIEKYNLIFDIEIDEPYVYNSGKPTHFNDEKRNDYFLANGWHIIRFAEEQVVRFPVLCCKIIAEEIMNLTGEHIWIEGFHEMEDVAPIVAWDKQLAEKMAKLSYRGVYLKQLKSIIKSEPTITILADGIYINKLVSSAKYFYGKEIYPDKDFSRSAQISLFGKGFYKYLRHFSNSNSKNIKVKVDFLIFISEYHSFHDFAFDEDLLSFEEFEINVYFHKTDNILCFEIDQIANMPENNNLMLIADDPAYPILVESWVSKNKKVILMRNRENTFMPSRIEYINIDYSIGLSIGLEAHEV